MELKDIEALLDAKIDPIKETIQKLERQQERIVEVVSNQAVMMNTVEHIQSTIDEKIRESTKVHDTLFERMRSLEKSGVDRLWDVIRLIIAAVVGGVISKLVGIP